MKLVKTISDIKNDPRIANVWFHYDGHGRHMVECIDGYKFENERTIEIGNVKEICYSINNNLEVVGCLKPNPMNISYSKSTVPGKLRTVHTIRIENEEFASTKAKEILTWAKPRIFDKLAWKDLKEAVRLGHTLQISGGGLFGNNDLHK